MNSNLVIEYSASQLINMSILLLAIWLGFWNVLHKMGQNAMMFREILRLLRKQHKLDIPVQHIDADEE